MASNQTTFALLLLAPLTLFAACDDEGGGQDTSGTGSTSDAAGSSSGATDAGETTAEPSTTTSGTTNAGSTGNSDPSLPTATDAGESGDVETSGTDTGGTDTGDELPAVPRVRVATLEGDTFAFTEAYPLSAGPGDTDWSRWGVMHDGDYVRLYFLPEGGADAIYQFALNPGSETFEFGYQSFENIPVTGTPSDADTSMFGMVHDGSYGLYLLSDDQQTAYGFGFDGGSEVYAHGFGVAPSTAIEGAPAGIDWSGWATASNGANTTLYAFASEDHDTLAQFDLDGDAFTYVDTPLTLNLDGLAGPLEKFAVAHDGSATHLYLVEVD